MKTFVVALRVALVTLVVTGILYPLLVTAIAQLVFPARANGSIITDDRGHEVGSELVGQAFATPAYLHGRPSANNYDAANSGGTNLGVTSKKLRDGVAQLVVAYRTENGLAPDAEVPADAVTSSASGLDPDVTLDNARLQVGRIAKARGVTPDRVKTIVESLATGMFSEQRVNVLAANLAFDRSFGRLTAR